MIIAERQLALGLPIGRRLCHAPRQLPVASAQLQAKSRERLQGAMDAIREMGLRDSDLLRYQVDPVKWFGSAHAALMLLTTKSGEEAAAWTPLF